MTEEAAHCSFNKLRSLFWPIHNHELKKIIPLLIIFLLVAFNYDVLRCIKDTLVITAKNSGAEVIPFIKVWVMFPTSVLFTWIFIRLSNRFSLEHVFYIMFSSFLVFFFLFAFIFYPRSEQFHLHSFANFLSANLPEGFNGFICMIRYWSFSIFYTMSELWSNIILSLLCWGFVNQITKIEEAKRFYSTLGIGKNLSGIFAGYLSIMAASKSTCWFSIDCHGDSWGPTLINLTTMVVLSGLATLAMFAYLNTVLKKNPQLHRADNDRSVKKAQTKRTLSLRETLRYLISSKYMLCIVTLIVSYNIVINLTEILWKHEVKALYPTPIQYNIFMNKVTTWTSIVATAASLIISGYSIRIFGWTKTALITPLILFITSVGFFTFFFLKGDSTFILALIGISPLQLVVLFGTLQNCCSRAAKYTVFDNTKEMAFIPLSHEEKIKGKAAIDGVCNRLGKSGGSLIYQFLLITFSTISACAPYVAFILFSIIAIWIAAVQSLGRQFHEKTAPAAIPMTTFKKTASPIPACIS